WVSGFWREVQPLPLPNQNQNPQLQAQPEIEYLQEPPATVENGPSVASPGDSYFYAPGCWVWRGRDVWGPRGGVGDAPDGVGGAGGPATRGRRPDTSSAMATGTIRWRIAACCSRRSCSRGRSTLARHTSTRRCMS